jgi:hypothetical protein
MWQMFGMDNAKFVKLTRRAYIFLYCLGIQKERPARE